MGARIPHDCSPRLREMYLAAHALLEREGYFAESLKEAESDPNLERSSTLRSLRLRRGCLKAQRTMHSATRHCGFWFAHTAGGKRAKAPSNEEMCSLTCMERSQ